MAVLTLSIADLERQTRLRRAKAFATGLLLAPPRSLLRPGPAGRRGATWAGFVNAGAEASMVGGLADWFAVTALFKHPLGLPIPHTALIPKRKDELGASLEEFVGENFLQEASSASGSPARGVSARVGGWLADPAHAAPGRSTRRPTALRGALDGAQRRATCARCSSRRCCRGSRRSRSRRCSGACSAEVVSDGAHHGLVDLALDGAARVAAWRTSDTWSPRSVRAGAVVGAARRRPRRSPAASTAELLPGRRAGPRRPATTTPAAPWTDAGRSSATTCCTTRRHRAGRAAQGAAARPPAGPRSGAERSGRCNAAAPLAAGARDDPDGAAAPPRAAELSALRRAARRATTRCAPRLDGWRADAAVLRRRRVRRRADRA